MSAQIVNVNTLYNSLFTFTDYNYIWYNKVTNSSYPSENSILVGIPFILTQPTINATIDLSSLVTSESLYGNINIQNILSDGNNVYISVNNNIVPTNINYCIVYNIKTATFGNIITLDGISNIYPFLFSLFGIADSNNIYYYLNTNPLSINYTLLIVNKSNFSNVKYTLPINNNTINNNIIMDSTNIYYFGYTNTNTYIYSFNKSTFINTPLITVLPSKFNTSDKITYTCDNTYIWYSIQINGGNISLYKYNKSTQTTILYYTYNSSSYSYSITNITSDNLYLWVCYVDSNGNYNINYINISDNMVNVLTNFNGQTVSLLSNASFAVLFSTDNDNNIVVYEIQVNTAPSIITNEIKYTDLNAEISIVNNATSILPGNPTNFMYNTYSLIMNNTPQQVVSSNYIYDYTTHNMTFSMINYQYATAGNTSQISLYNNSTNNVMFTFPLFFKFNISFADSIVITTPSSIVLLSPCEINIANILNIDAIINHNIILINNLNNIISSNFKINGNNITFYNVIIPYGGNNQLFVYDTTISMIIYTFSVETTGICFKEGTKILCLINKQEKYIPIEKIEEDMFVKIYSENIYLQKYKKAKYIIKSSIMNSVESTINKLYRLPREKDNRLIEDLYVTGSHALFHDYLNETEMLNMQKLYDYYNNYEIRIENKSNLTEDEIEKIKMTTKYYNDYKINYLNKYKLIAYYDNRFEELNIEKVFNIYHIILENTNKYDIYAIYANGVLAETTCEASLLRFPHYETINCKSHKQKENILKNNKDNFIQDKIKDKIMKRFVEDNKKVLLREMITFIKYNNISSKNNNKKKI
jgi:hypothetical protein